MSLTSQLAERNSPIAQWMRAHVDPVKTRALVTTVNERLARTCPLVVDRSEPQLVGRAFDFAFRWQLGSPTKTVAHAGALFCAGDGWEAAPAIMTALVATGDAAGATDTRWRACLILSWFEMYARGYPATAALQACWGTSATPETIAALLDLVPAGALADLTALMAEVNTNWDLPMEGLFRLNPTFKGSRDLGGADADWIAGTTLWECKVSWRPRPFQGVHLLQGLGYVLLDYDDAYGLTALGYYFPRQRERISWPLTTLLAQLCGTTDLMMLRTSLRHALSHSQDPLRVS